MVKCKIEGEILLTGVLTFCGETGATTVHLVTKEFYNIEKKKSTEFLK